MELSIFKLFPIINIKLMKINVFERAYLSWGFDFTCNCESDLIFLCLSLSLFKMSPSIDLFPVSYIMANVG